MSQAYVYLYLSKEVGQDKLEKLLTRVLEGENKYELSRVADEYYSLSILNGYRGLGALQSSFSAASEDINFTFKGIVVPTLNERFIQYLKYVRKSSLVYLFQVAMTHQEIYKENVDLLDFIDEYTLMTVKAYIEASNSPSLASYRLFVHRNTVTYRIDRFIQESGFDLKYFSTAIFVYFLIIAKYNGQDFML